MGCAAITRGGGACDVKKAGGTVPKAYAFNLDDIDGYTEVTNMPILKAGKVGYIFEGYKNDIKPTTETISLGVGPDVFKHNFGFMGYDKSTAAKANYKNLVQGKTVWIYEQNGKYEDSFQLIGSDCGLSNVPGVIQNPHENLGVFVFNLSTAEGDFEGDLPKTVFTVDYETTQEAIEALCVEASSGS